MSLGYLGAVTSVPPAVAGAFERIERMLTALRALRHGYPTHTLAIADVFDPITEPTIAAEPGYIDWPNADFKANEIAWAVAIQYLGLSGITWKFPLRRKVSEAYDYTAALLTKAREVAVPAGKSSNVPLVVGGGLLLLAVLA